MYMCIVNNLICKIWLVNKLIKKTILYWIKILYFLNIVLQMFCKLRQNILVNIITIVIRTDVSKIDLTYTHNSTKVKLTIFFIKWMMYLVLFHIQTDEQILII